MMSLLGHATRIKNTKNYELQALESAMFSEEFDFVIQRMWAFRIFRIRDVPRTIMLGWFKSWNQECVQFLKA